MDDQRSTCTVSLQACLALWRSGKLPCDNHAAQVEVKTALKYKGEKKTLYGGRGKTPPSKHTL